VSEALPSDVAERVHHGIATALRTGHAEIEYRLVHDGAERVFDVVFAAHATKDVTAFISDATGRAAAEQRLLDSEQRFRSVVELANEGVWMIDAEGLTTFATPSMAAILGCAPEDMLGRPPREFMDEASRLAFAERQARRQRGETEASAFTLRSVDGRDVPTTLAARPISDQDGRYIGSVALVNDETQRLKAERELDESRRRLGAIVEAHDDVFYVGEILPDGSYFEHYCGPGSERLLGGELPPEDDNMAETWDRAVHVQDRQAYADMNQQLANGEAVDFEYRLVGRDGRIRWVHDCARPRTSEDGRLVFDGVVSDITERRERADALQAALASVQSAHEELSAAHAASEHLARTDSLTELFNRRHFRHALEAELARHDRGGEAPGIILIDIDHFKRINDSHGHECGDRVLSEIAARLASAIRPYDVLARWGGEEFILLTPDTADADDLKQMGEKLIAAIRSTPISTPAASLEITASAGAARREHSHTTADALIDSADRALYAAKHRGRDRVVLEHDIQPEEIARIEPEVIRLAEGLALAASIREGRHRCIASGSPTSPP
jgi:diguanylate cyclase (GGDEF)-like protein/PAS domain S-box-containing protein